MSEEVPGFDLYATLQISADADPEVVAAAHRALIRRGHPDVTGAAGLEHSKHLNIARDWLLDPDRRARYDVARDVVRHEPQVAPRRANGSPASDQTANGTAPGDYGPNTAAVEAFIAWAARASADELLAFGRRCFALNDRSAYTDYGRRVRSLGPLGDAPWVRAGNDTVAAILAHHDRLLMPDALRWTGYVLAAAHLVPDRAVKLLRPWRELVDHEYGET